MDFIRVIIIMVSILGIVAVFKSCGKSNACSERGIGYYKEIGSYPTLSSGKTADEQIKDMCSRNSNAFQ